MVPLSFSTDHAKKFTKEVANKIKKPQTKVQYTIVKPLNHVDWMQ